MTTNPKGETHPPRDPNDRKTAAGIPEGHPRDPGPTGEAYGGGNPSPGSPGDSTRMPSDTVQPGAAKPAPALTPTTGATQRAPVTPQHDDTNAPRPWTSPDSNERDTADAADPQPNRPRRV